MTSRSGLAGSCLLKQCKCDWTAGLWIDLEKSVSPQAVSHKRLCVCNDKHFMLAAVMNCDLCNIRSPARAKVDHPLRSLAPALTGCRTHQTHKVYQIRILCLTGPVYDLDWLILFLAHKWGQWLQLGHAKVSLKGLQDDLSISDKAFTINATEKRVPDLIWQSFSAGLDVYSCISNTFLYILSKCSCRSPSHCASFDLDNLKSSHFTPKLKIQMRENHRLSLPLPTANYFLVILDINNGQLLSAGALNPTYRNGLGPSWLRRENEKHSKNQ